MAEQSAHVIRTTATAATGTAHVDAIANAIMGIGMHWLWLDSEPGKALFECVATGAQLVLHGTASNIQVGYAPDGGVTDWNGTPTAAVFSGMRNISGNTLAFGAITTALSIAEYEDGLLVALGSTVAGWRVAALAGRVMEPMDDSDISRNIGRDALLVGVPSRASASPGWLFGTSTSNVGSCVRTGASFVGLAVPTAYVLTPGSAVSDRYLARINDVERMVPYIVHILSAAGVSQIVCHTKYLRQWRANVSHGTRLFSQTAGSDQAWHGHQFDATNINQFVLWSKTETTV